MFPQTVPCPRCANPAADHYLAPSESSGKRDAQHIWCPQCLFHSVTEVQTLPKIGGVAHPAAQSIAAPSIG